MVMETFYTGITNFYLNKHPFGRIRKSSKLPSRKSHSEKYGDSPGNGSNHLQNPLENVYIVVRSQNGVIFSQVLREKQIPNMFTTWKVDCTTPIYWFILTPH